MTAPKFLVASLAALFLAVSAMGQTPAPAGNNPPPTKLAVVNIVKIFDMLQEKQDADRDIETMKDKMQADIQKKKADLEQLEKDLKDGSMFAPGSPDFKKMQDDALQKSMELQVYSQMSQQKLFLELRVRTADIYRKMNEAIATYSQQNGIALVFVADDLNLAGARTQEQLQAMVTVRKVVYFHPQFDITTKVIEKMNTDYRLRPSTPAK